MVIRDFDLKTNAPADDKSRRESPQDASFGTASPLDRFASGVIDYVIILMPFVYLIIAPFERAMKESALYSDHLAITVLSSLAIAAGLLFVISYQAVLIYIWGATVGQRIMGLSTRSVWTDDKIKLSQAFLRALIWALSWAAFGIPLLAIFSNRLRRPFHDRIADALVVSLRKERSVRSPTLYESALVKGIFWAVGTIVVAVGGFVLFTALHSLDNQRDLVSNLESENVLCETISEATAEWPNENGAQPERLSVALSLYAAGVTDRKCLQAEVEYLHKFDEPSPLLYLAKSFVYADRPELSDKYLERICSRFQNSTECHMSRVIQAVADEDWDTMQAQFALLKSSGYVYPAIWAVRQFLKHEDYHSADEYLSLIPESHELSEFVSPARAKTLWALNRQEEALGVESVAYSTLGVESKLDLSSYMCFEKIWSNCDAVKNNSCETFSKISRTYDDVLNSTVSSLAYLRLYECNSEGPPDYEKLLSYPLNDNVKALTAALSASGTDGFSDLLDDVSNDESTSSIFSAEVSRRLAERAKSLPLLKQLTLEWQTKPATPSWQKVGLTLFKKLYSLHEYKLSTDIASRMNTTLEMAPVNRSIAEDFVVAAFKSGHLDLAHEIFNRYAKNYPLPILNGQQFTQPAKANLNASALRMTASEDDSFNAIAKKLTEPRNSEAGP